MLWVLKRTVSRFFSTQNICLKLLVRKDLQFNADNFSLSKPVTLLFFGINRKCAKSRELSRSFLDKEIVFCFV